MSDGDPSVTERLGTIRALVRSSRAITVMAGPHISSPGDPLPVPGEEMGCEPVAPGAGAAGNPVGSQGAVPGAHRAAGDGLTHPRAVDVDSYRRDEALRVRVWGEFRRDPVWEASPTAVHRAVAALGRAGRLEVVLAQGVDGLFLRAGVDRSRLLELHGTLHVVECLSCGCRVDSRGILARLDSGEADPRCGDCGGPLKPGTVAAGQALDPDVLYAAVLAVQRSQLLLVAGADLGAQPAASLVEIAVGAGVRVAMLMPGPGSHDRLGGLWSHGDVAGGLLAVLRDVPAVPSS